MSPEEIRRVKELFLAAADRPAAERAAWLDGQDACPAIRAQVGEQLLLLDHETFELGLPVVRSDAARPQPTRIGRYELLREIGEGGFGTVFLAEQTEPVRRHVALKVIKVGMDTKQVIARFEAERQALALMDHPNIAKVH